MKNAKKNSFFEFSRARGVKMAAIYMSIRKAYCSLRNEMERNEIERNEMKICSLRNGNL